MATVEVEKTKAAEFLQRVHAEIPLTAAMQLGLSHYDGQSLTLAAAPEAMERIASAMPGQFSSTAQDLARGKPTEIDHLNGFVARRGAELGVPTPVNRTLHALVKLAEAARVPA